MRSLRAEMPVSYFANLEVLSGGSIACTVSNLQLDVSKSRLVARADERGTNLLSFSHSTGRNDVGNSDSDSACRNSHSEPAYLPLHKIRGDIFGLMPLRSAISLS